MYIHFQGENTDCRIFSCNSFFCLHELQLIVFFFQTNVFIRYFEGIIHPHSICDVMKEYSVDQIQLEYTNECQCNVKNILRAYSVRHAFISRLISGKLQFNFHQKDFGVYQPPTYQKIICMCNYLTRLIGLQTDRDFSEFRNTFLARWYTFDKFLKFCLVVNRIIRKLLKEYTYIHSCLVLSYGLTRC